MATEPPDARRTAAALAVLVSELAARYDELARQCVAGLAEPARSELAEHARGVLAELPGAVNEACAGGPEAWTDPATGTAWPLTGRLVEPGGEWWTHSGWLAPFDAPPIPVFACHYAATGEPRDGYEHYPLPEIIRRYGPLTADSNMPADPWVGVLADGEAGAPA